VFTGSHVDYAGAFDAYLERIDRSSGTRKIYGRAVRELIEAGSGKPLTSWSPVDIDAYLADWRRKFWVQNGRTPCPATYRSRINALRAFYAWLERFDLLRDDRGVPMPNPTRQVIAPRVDQKRNDWLRPTEDAALLNCPMTATERIVVSVLRWTGMRVGEASALLVGDVDLTPRLESITIRTSKTEAGQRQVPVTPLLQVELQHWLRSFMSASVHRQRMPSWPGGADVRCHRPTCGDW
jgi:integrase